MPVPTSACSRTRTGGITGVKPRSSPPRGGSRAGVVAEKLNVGAPRFPRLADLPDDLVVVSGRRIRQVREREQQGRAALLDGAQLLLELLLAIGQTARLGDRLRGVVAAALQLADSLAGLVLARPQVLELRQECAAALVELERLVERGGIDSSARERVARRLRIFAGLPEGEHRDPPRCLLARPPAP